MVQGLTRCTECDPVLERDSRNSQRVSSRAVQSYERRPRRKTKPDRYEPYKATSVSEQGSPRPRRPQKKTNLMKQNNSRLGEKFRAKNIKTGRLTLASNENLGIFKKGKTSSPVSSVKVSYPSFSELRFLAKESQAATPEEEVQRSLLSEHDRTSPRGNSSDAFLEKELFQVLTDCRQLSVPYEKYMPRCPNSWFVSLEDLKDLCRDLDNTWSQRKGAFKFNPATEKASHGVHHATCGRTRTYHAYFSNPLDDAAKDAAKHEEMLEMLLDSVEDFDQDVALEVLAEIVEPGTDIYEHLRVAGHTDYAHEMDAIASVYSYDAPCTLEDDCEGSPTMGHGENSVISSAMQTRYNDKIVPIGCPIRDFRDMEKGGTVKISALGISSALDDRHFQTFQKPAPTLTTTHIPVNTAVHNQQTHTISRRPFWRCNKLY